MADGIKIKINCDIRGAEKAMKQLEGQVSRLQAAERKTGHLNENYKALGAEAKKAYAEAEKALKKYQEASERAKKRLEVVETGVKAEKPGATRADLDEAIGKDKSLQSLDAAAERAAAEYEQLAARAETLSQKHAHLGATLSAAKQDLAAERTATQNLREEINHTDFVVRRFATSFATLGQQITGKVSQAFAKIPSIVKSALGKASALAVSGFKKMGNAVKNLTKRLAQTTANLLKFRRHSKGASSGAQGFAKAIVKLGTMLKMLVLRQAMRAVIKAAKEGFENLAQYSTSANANMSALMSSLTRLKNSFATVFAPIFSVVEPALTAFIDKLSEAVSAVSALFAALSGSKTFTKATAVTEDYAASLDDADSSAKGAKKTFSFDNLNQLQGSSGGGYTDPTPAEMFEEVNVPTWIADLVDLVKAEDWAGVGTYISDAINAGMTSLRLMISWDNTGDTITRVVNGITGTINSLVSNIRWDQLGQTLGTGLNTLIHTLYLLLTGIDWYGIGQALATGLNGLIAVIDWDLLGATLGAKFNMVLWLLLGAVQTFDWVAAGLALAAAVQGMVNTIDWAGIGRLISDFLIGAFTLLYVAIEGFDWYGLGESVKTMLVSIDWGGVFNAMCRAMGAAFGALTAFLWGLLQEAWEQIVAWWQENAYEDGKFTIQGLLQGIIDVFASIGAWINDHIFKPFIEGFKNAFGIHSPSTVMAEMGGYLIDGLKEGCLGLWEKISGIFTGAIDHIRETFSIENLKSIGTNAVTGMVNGLKTIGSKAKEWGSGILGNIKDALGIHSPSTETREVGEYTVAGYVNGLENYMPLLKRTLQSMVDFIINLYMSTASKLQQKQAADQSAALHSAQLWTSQIRNLFQTLYSNLSLQTDTWMSRVREMFQSFYANLNLQTSGWASNLQATLDRMVSAAKQAAREIAMAQASASSSKSSGTSTTTSSSKSSSTSTGKAKALSMRAAQGAALRVPAYATGKVLPANNPHLAIVGDQRQGTNIETQLSTMMQAFRQVMSESGGGGNRPLQVNLYLDTGARLGRALIPSLQEAAAGRSVAMTAKGGMGFA